MPHGGKGRERAQINLEKHLAKKRSIVRIQNNNELCLARALVVAKAKIEKDPQLGPARGGVLVSHIPDINLHKYLKLR
jgi:hypothetical protein